MVFRPLLRTPRALPLTRKLLKKFDQNLYAINAATSKLFFHCGEVSETEQSLIKTFIQPTPRPLNYFPTAAK